MSYLDRDTDLFNVGIRSSIGRKTFLSLLLLTMGIGAAALVAGAMIYMVGITHEFAENTWNQSNALASLLDQKEYQGICDRVIDIYDSCPEDLLDDKKDQEYLSLYAGIRESEEFQELLVALHSLQNRNGPLNAFITAVDPEYNRTVYIVDADQKEDTTCLPGTWDEYPHEDIMELINGRELSIIDKRMGVEQRVQAAFTNIQPYGRRCTAGATLYQKGRYTVMVCVDEKLTPLVKSSRVFLIQYVMMLIIVTLGASYLGMRRMRNNLVVPINRLAEAAINYGKDEDREEGVRHFDHLDISTGDELERLAETLRDMESDVADYMDNLTRATTEKEHIRTELALAAKIQNSMLQLDFPAFPGRNEFDLYASMEPARDVGGDFYDMILLDDDHLAIEIADVSGKGIPAALYMMASKILLADALRSKSTPAEILEDVNNKICERNEGGMFVTVWLGILEISTGRMITSNAGHEYPVIVHADGTAEVIRDKHGFVLGGMEGMKYTNHELTLEKGGSIFVYTDGVTEASSLNDELFGMDRMMDAVRNAGAGADPHQIMMSVRDDIRAFTEGAEQFDDLTMLCLKYIGKGDN